MRYYIIFAPTISGIGGAELYVKNKAKWLSSKGWKCCIVTANDEQIMIPEFFELYHLTFPELSYPAYYYSKKTISRVVESMTTGLENLFGDQFYSLGEAQVLVESIDISVSTWADMMAEKLGSRNFLYYVGWEALFHTWPRTQREYVRVKAERNEFLLASELSAKIMFGESELSTKVSYFNIPVVPEDYFDFENQNDETFCRGGNIDAVVLTVTRLEKPYLREFLEQMILLDRKGYKLKILVLGGSLDRKLKEKLEDEYSNKFRNSEIQFLGWRYPLPYGIFKCVDIFVGMGTSVLNAASIGVPSIVVDFSNNMSAGFFGVDTDNWVYSSSGKVRTISEDVERAIRDKKMLEISAEKAQELVRQEFDQEKLFTSFIDFMITSSSPKNRCAERDLAELFQKLDLRERVKSTILRIFGIHSLDKVLSAWFKLIGKRKLEKVLSGGSRT